MGVKLSVSPKANGYVLEEDYVIFKDWLTIPAKFRWRARSMPKWCWYITVGSPFNPKVVRASMVRDFLMPRMDVSGACTDNLFLNTLLEDGVSKCRAYALYSLARLGRLFK